MSMFPQLAVQPGEYPCEWVVGGRNLPGDLHLGGARPPRMNVYEDVTEIDWADGKPHGFPQEHEFPRLTGRTRSNLDVVLVDATVSTWFPRLNSGYARYAVVGLGIAAAQDDRFRRIRLQITGADTLLGVFPLKEISWPSRTAEVSEERYSAVLNPDSRLRWKDDGLGLTIECGYDSRLSPGPYRFEVVFAPIFEFCSARPFSIDDWVRDWVSPLLRAASLATRAPQRLAWLTVQTVGHDEANGRTGVVFGSGIDQEPFQASRPDASLDPDSRPLFSFPELPVGLPELLLRLRKSEASDNPFMELYLSTLFQSDLPQRARLLYLIQALEALHSFESRATDERDQRKFEEGRNSLLSTIESLGLDPREVSFLRRSWGKRKPDQLDRRLAAVLRQVPLGVRANLRSPEMNALARKMTGAATLPAQLRVIRNELSHGRRSFDERDLRPWVRATEFICQAHALRLIGFDGPAIEQGLASPSANP
jgi:ApeA N-terminal domain 1